MAKRMTVRPVCMMVLESVKRGSKTFEIVLGKGTNDRLADGTFLSLPRFIQKQAERVFPSRKFQTFEVTKVVPRDKDYSGRILEADIWLLLGGI